MKRSMPLLVLIVVIMSACAPGAQTAAPATQAASQPTAAASAAAGGAPAFVLLGVLNRDTAQAGQSPSLTTGSTTADTAPTLWATWAENSAGNVRQVFVSEHVGDAFQARGASVNIHTNVVADYPSITFAGANRLVPWAAWAEPSPGFNNVTQVFASRFNGATGLWQQAGQDRGGGEASLNLQTNQAATNPFIFSGSATPGKPPVPWVAWEESSRSSSFQQIFVARAVKDETNDPTVLGGFRWEVVGQLKDGEPGVGIDRFRDSLRPVGVFAETGNAVPWVTWYEEGHDRPSRVFTSRGVADPKTPGGFKWLNVPACTPDETVCALNTNPLKDAEDPSMAAGSVTAGDAAVPWISWTEVGPTGKHQIFVSRLDTKTRNSFLLVGASLNVDPNHDAKASYITFVGNVPYVGWLEDDGSGKFRVQLRHLGSDPQTGTWVLDSPAQGFNHNPDVTASEPFHAAASQDTLFLTWVEGDPASSASQVIVGEFK
jgi:hypothetical protein